MDDKHFFAEAVVPALRKATRFNATTSLNELFVAFVRGEITYAEVDFLSGEFLQNVLEFAEAEGVEDGPLGQLVLQHAELNHPRFLGQHADPAKYGFRQAAPQAPGASQWVRGTGEDAEEVWGDFEDEDGWREFATEDILIAARLAVADKADEFVAHLDAKDSRRP
jgi:hypothetical protein